jgi:OFA family oxalate/formate antiporter-like MFS transporter
MKGNKWLNAVLPAFLVHLCIGVIYCWSTIKIDFARELNVAVAELEPTFSLSIFFIGLMAMISGIGRFNMGSPKINVIICWALSAIGFSGLVWSINIQDLRVFNLFFGVFLGSAVGWGYLRPIRNVIMWFPKNGAGIAIGTALSGFGLSKVIFAPLMPYLNDIYGLETTVYILMGLGCVLFLIATLLIKRPEQWVAPIRFGVRDLIYLTFKGSFYRIWIMFLIITACGLSIISFEKALADSMKIENVTWVVIVSALSNAAGRFVGGAISDRMLRKEINYVVLTALCGIVGFIIVLIGKFSVATMIGYLVIINWSFGASFATLPVLLKERFPYEALTSIYGLALFAWGIAGFIGSSLGHFVIYDHNGKFVELIAIISVLFFVALVLALSLLLQKKYRANLSNLLYFQKLENRTSEGND